ncbi:MAG: hypothetical protein GX107_06610 [Clostridiales bacterium]|jgi:hypothetical protein|nr:hypothetical protein [Clostridiales bacterium]
MKNKSFKIISIIMSLCIIFSAVTVVPAAAAGAGESVSSDSLKVKLVGEFFAALTRGVDKFVNGILKVIAAVMPQSSGCTKLGDYESKNFFSGSKNFLDEAPKSAQWSLGYGQRVLTPEDLLDRPYYMGGFDVANVITGKHDDIKVRCVCIDDGTRRGKVIFAVIDAVGLSNKDVRGIRETFIEAVGGADDFAAVNISVTHTHSGIDTQGIWAVFGVYSQDKSNILKSLFPIFNKGEPVSGVDKTFMQRVYTLSAEAMIDACDSMTPGEMYYAEKDAGKYFKVRKDPSNFIKEISRFRFEPNVNNDDDESNDVAPTIIANFGCHPETVGYGGSIMSADFIPYMEQVMNEAGYNFLFIQGAIGAMITSSRGPSNDGLKLQRYQEAIRQGEELAYFVLGMTYDEQECKDLVVDHEREAADLAALGDNASAYTPWYEDWTAVKEQRIDPFINIAIEEVIIKIDNPILKIIGKLGVTSNDLLKDDRGTFYTAIEIGYIEFGKNIKVLMSPGETNPDFVNGGISMSAETSTHRKDFQYAPLKELSQYFGEDDHILVFDEMNDAAGYINPDNDYALIVLRYTAEGVGMNTNALLFSFAKNIGSTLIGTFLEIIEAHK